MANRLDQLVAALAAEDVAEDAFNQYADGNPFNAIRRDNFRLYLGQMMVLRPKVLLVGEAPGYQGCRRSGVPFTSDHLMLNPPDGVPVLGAAAGYRDSGEFGGLRKEPSATIVWGAIAETGLVPLIFSAYPFHPHKKGRPLSNRPPRADELAVGRRYLADILAIFAPETVIAVGNSAARTLTAMAVDHVNVRHPSHGGKAAFWAGFRAVAESYG